MAAISAQVVTASPDKRCRALLLALALIPAAVCLGVIAALGSIKIAMLAAGAIIGLVILSLSANASLLILIVVCFLVVGQLMYFGGYTQAYWIPYGLGIILYLKWAAQKLYEPTPYKMTLVSAFVALFLLATYIAYMVNQSPPLQALAGGKNLVALWSVYFIIAGGLVASAIIVRVWKLFYWILLFQIPLVIYQYVYVAPSRTRFGLMKGAAWDSVVGGFGGDPESGGAAGTLAFFVCLVSAYAIARYRHGLTGKLTTLSVIAGAVFCIALAEVKVVVVFIVIIAFVLLLFEKGSRRLLFSIVILPVALGASSAVLVIYGKLHYELHYASSSSLDITKPEMLVNKAFGYSLDPYRIGPTGEMSRLAALVHWKNEVMNKDAGHTVFGYGPGASRSKSITGVGEAAAKYPFRIDRSAAVQLLWDTGLVGLLSYCLALLVALVQAYRLARASGISHEEAAVLKATTAGLAMACVMLFYGRDLLELPAVSLLVMIMLGYVASWRARSPNQQRV